MQLEGKVVLVTGGRGFFGTHICRALRCRGARVIAVGRAEGDLREAGAVAEMLERFQPHLVVHAAGRVGGIGANRRRPAEFLYDNALMGLNVIEQSRRAGVDKVVVLGTICSYPKHAPLPMREEDLWNGYPEETNAPYGIAKRLLLVQCQAYRKQYGLNAVYLLPVNLYGPGDDFREDSSHVIPALIRKCLEARDGGLDHIVVWGSGQATREFLYVEEAAEAVALAAERYDGEEPLNLPGTGEITIARLARLVAKVTGFEGEIRWDPQMPEGQPRRCLDGSRARRYLGWEPRISLEEGLRRTVEWYGRARALAGCGE